MFVVYCGGIECGECCVEVVVVCVVVWLMFSLLVLVVCIVGV